MFSKVLLEDMGPFTLLGIRFIIGFAVLFFAFFDKMRKITKKNFIYGILIGIANFAVMAFELSALKLSTPSMTSFLEHTAIVMVPIFESVLTKSLPKAKVIICDIMALAGIGLLSFTGEDGFNLSAGEILCFITAVVYAVSIILTARLSAKSEPISVGIVQIGFMGAVAIIAAFIFETPTLPKNGLQWAYLLILALIVTGIGFAMKPLAVSKMTAQITGTLAAINPLAAAFFSAIFMAERLSFAEIAGAVLIIAGIVLIYLLPDSFRKRA